MYHFIEFDFCFDIAFRITNYVCFDTQTVYNDMTEEAVWK